MALKKKDFGDIKKKFSTSAKYKPQRFFDLGQDFLEAVGLSVPVIVHLNMLLGHSDTGKTTALIKNAFDAKKKEYYLSLLSLNRNGVSSTQNLWVLNVKKL